MSILSLVIASASIIGTWAYSNGARDCGTINHGTFQSTLPSGMTLSLIDTSTSAAVSQWSAGKTYTVQIQSTAAFKGWSWAPLKGNPASFTAGSATMAGSFAAGDSYSHANTGCAGSITQSSGGTGRTLVKATWTAPAAGTGTVSLWALISVSKNGNNYNAVQTVTELTSGTSVSSTRTHTVAASASKGASTSATATMAPTPSSAAVIAAVSSSPSAAAVTSAAAHASHAPLAVTSAVQQSSNTSVAAIAIGSGLAGGVLVALVGVVIAVMNKRQKKPLHFTPTVIVNSPLPHDDANPYMANVSRSKLSFNATQVYV